MLSVYVSCASKEIERAEKMMAALRAAGVHVTSTWAENIRKVGAANPRDASIEDRQKWSLQDVREAIESDVFWIMMPGSFSAAYEFGFFSALASANKTQLTIASGDYMATIFTSYSTCFDTDEQALEAIIAMSKTVTALVPHDLIKTGDPDAYDAIKDRNGEVVLAVCRVCKQGEGTLEPSCPGPLAENGNAAQPEG